MGPYSTMTCVLTEGDIWTHTRRRTLCKGEGRDWVTLLQAREHQRLLENQQKRAEGHGQILLDHSLQKELLDLGFLASRTVSIA